MQLCKTCKCEIKGKTKKHNKFCSRECYYESLKLPDDRFDRVKKCLSCNKEFASTQHSQLLIDANYNEGVFTLSNIPAKCLKLIDTIQFTDEETNNK